MELIAKMKAFDIVLFKFVNITLYNGLIASFIKIIANDITVVLVLAAGLYYIARNFTQKVKLDLCFGLWAVIITNFLCTFLLKPVFHRMRPVVTVEDMHQLAWVSRQSFSFPSTHAAMAAAITVVLWDGYKAFRPWMAVFNLALAFFCVYTGGHFPLDVMAGSVLGIITGFIFGKLKELAAAISSLRK
jgi:undecaprenyl-diphosphatase